MNFLASTAEFLGVLANELLIDSGGDSPIVDRLRGRLQKQQLESEGSEAMVKCLDLAPLDDSGTHALSEVKRVEYHKTPGSLVLFLLHAPVQPFDGRDDALEMLLIFCDGQGACIFGTRQRSIGMRLG